MSIKRYSNSGQIDTSTNKRYSGSELINLTTAKRWNGSEYINLLPEESKQQVKTYALAASQMYWGNGTQDNQSATSNSLMHGTYSGSSKIRRSLLWFDSQLKTDLAGAEIKKVEIYLYRENNTHGSGGAGNVFIKTHNYSSKPTKWSGTDSGAADSGTPTLKRGAGAWFTLLNSVGEDLRDSNIQGIALDADSSTKIADYIRFAKNGKNAPKLRITYIK